jgi:integrase
MWVQSQGERHRGFYRDAAGIARSKTFDYAHQAEAWAKVQELQMRFPAVFPEPTPEPEPIEELEPEPPAGPTLAEYADLWLTRLTAIRTATRNSYRGHLFNRVLPALGDTPLDGLRRGQVREWVAGMEQSGEVGPASRNAALKVLRMVCKAAREEDPPLMSNTDPTAGIRRQKPLLKSRRQYLSPEDVEALLDATEDVTWVNLPSGGRRVQLPAPGMLRLAILLGVDAGLRWEEISALNVTSILTAGSAMTIRIWRTSDRKGRIHETTKNGEPREIPVASERLRKALAIRIREARLEHGIDALLISRPDGSTARYEHWTRVLLKGAVQAAGIYPEPQGWHDLRHTFGSRLAEQGVPTKMISTLMGHSEEDVTQIYMHSSTQAVLRSVMESALGG